VEIYGWSFYTFDEVVQTIFQREIKSERKSGKVFLRKWKTNAQRVSIPNLLNVHSTFSLVRWHVRNNPAALLYYNSLNKIYNCWSITIYLKRASYYPNICNLFQLHVLSYHGRWNYINLNRHPYYISFMKELESSMSVREQD